MIDLDHQDGVFILHMRNGENRFNLEFFSAFHAALDEVEKSEGPAALVTTGEGKFYTNGLDLSWLMGEGASQQREFGREIHRFFLRLLTFPMATVAAVNGHVFAAGAVAAMAQDFRVMRSDRGFFCLPEVDLKVPFSPGVMGIVKARIESQALHEAVLTGRRIPAEEALVLRLVDEAVPEAEVLPRALERARALSDKDRATTAALKRGMYPDVIALLEAGTR